MSVVELNEVLSALDASLAKDLTTLRAHYDEDRKLLSEIIARLGH